MSKRKKGDVYPTWNRVSPREIVSVEGQNDSHGKWRPDFLVWKASKHWFAKWRTSACTDGPYDTAAEAMQEIEKSLAAGPLKGAP